METPAPTASDVAERVRLGGVAPLVAAGCASRSGSGEWVREVGGSSAAASERSLSATRAADTPAAHATYFDLASVTKPMLAMAFAKSGIDRKTPLGALLPEARGTASEAVPLELLLAHRAGLVGHVALYEPLVRGERVEVSRALVTAADARRDDARGAAPPGGFAPVYSDLGYILAGAALARCVGKGDAGDAIRELVLAPLGLEREVGTAKQLEAEGIALPLRAAATENVAWRGGFVVGRVHDENGWALAGLGGAGHAGMFGTVDGVIAFGIAVLDALHLGHRGAPDIRWLVSERPGGTLRAGFDGKSAEGSSAGGRFGPRSFGHLGFTGTSLWIDPDANIVVVLLTNRVNPTRDNLAIRAARPIAHDALFARAQALRAQEEQERARLKLERAP